MEEIKNDFRTHILKEWIQRFLFNFFFPDFQQVITFNQDVFKNCKYSITRNTNRSLFFSQNKGMCEIRVTNM